MAITMNPLRRSLSSQMNEDDDIVKARLLKALADPVRQRIVRLLGEAGDTLSVEALVDNFALAQPTISHHLRILYDAGLLQRRKERTYVYYSVRHEVLRLASSILADLASF